MAIIDTATIKHISIDVTDQSAIITLSVRRDDGLNDALTSASQPVLTNVQLNAGEVVAAQATHAGSTLNGGQWYVGLRKAIMAAIATKLAANNDAVSTAVKTAAAAQA